MKKLLLAVLMVLSTTAALAGDSDALKAIKKAKTYAEAEQLINSSLSSLANNEEKATAYNKLYELAYKAAFDEISTQELNRTAAQLGQEEKPVNEEALYSNLSKAIKAAEQCYEYDNQPNAKGKVAPKYTAKAAQALYPIRPYLINGGGYYQEQKDNSSALAMLKQYCETAESPLFASVKAESDPNLSQAAFYTAYIALTSQDYATAEKFCDYALTDATYGNDALNIKLEAMRRQLNNHEDSVAYAAKVRAIYEKNPDNQQVMGTLFDLYNSMGQGDEAMKMVDQRLAANPNNFIALLAKGQQLYINEKYDEAEGYLLKAVENAPTDRKCFATAELGNCYFFHAQGRLNAFKGQLTPAAKQSFAPVYQKAIDQFEAAKALDTDGSQKSLYAARLYSCYYFLYGEADSRTEAARTYAGY